MESTFWAGFHLGVFLFPGFKVTSVTGFVFTCIAAGSLAFLSEAVKVFLLAKARRKEQIVVPPPRNVEETPLVRIRNRRERLPDDSQSCLGHTADTLVYLMYTMSAYLQMLAVMSFNVWLFLSVVLGSSAGYAIFSHKEQQKPPAGLVFPGGRMAGLDVQSPTDSIDPDKGTTRSARLRNRSDCGRAQPAPAKEYFSAAAEAAELARAADAAERGLARGWANRADFEALSKFEKGLSAAKTYTDAFSDYLAVPCHSRSGF